MLDGIKLFYYHNVILGLIIICSLTVLIAYLFVDYYKKLVVSLFPSPLFDLAFYSYLA